MEKLVRLKSFRSTLNKQLAEREDVDGEFDRESCEKELSLVNNLIKEGETGNFLTIDKHLIWDKYAMGKNKWLFSEDSVILEEIKNLKKEDRILDNEFMSLKSNYRNMENKDKNGLGTKNSFPEPKRVICSNCGETEFFVKFVIPKQNFSKKNNWGFWTENEKYKDQEWCGQCLRKIFYDKENYWQAVQSSKRRSLFRVYLARGEI